MSGGIGKNMDEDRDWSARGIARLNQSSHDRPLSPIMKTAATACELAHGHGDRPGAPDDPDGTAGQRDRQTGSQRKTSAAKRSD